MKPDSKILTAYSFLAALTENNKDIYGTVFVPLCKRALSIYAKSAREGSADDIKRILSEEYGLDVPLSIVRSLINRIAYNQTRKEKADFNLRVMEKGNSFAFDNYNCDRIESVYDEERRRANALEEAFKSYAELEGYNEVPSFQSFIDDNKHKLSTFFSGNYDSLNDYSLVEGFLPHAKFLRKIESDNHLLYQAAEKAYLGSLVAAYLEAGVDLDSKLQQGVVYYIDTRVILEALDLQGPETTRPAIEILDLIKSTGGFARVLSITVEEISHILDKEIINYSKNHPSTTIGDACARLNRSKSWLISFKGNIEKTIYSLLGISVDLISDSKIKEYAISSDVQDLVDIRYGKANAIHDVSAYLCVRERRSIHSNERPQKSNYWFVSANHKLGLFNKKHSNGVPEIIMPEELTSLLFLKDPSRYSAIVSKQGLSAMIARTLTDEYADKDLINEFNSAIRSSSIELSKDDYELLLEHVALESTSWLQHLMDESQNPERFNDDVHRIVEKARNQKSEQAKAQKSEQEYKESVEIARIQMESKNKELSRRLDNLENKVKEVERERLELLAKNEIQSKRINRWKNVGIGLLIALISLVIISFVPLKAALKSVFEWIAASGGLWSFLSFILNIIKAK